MKFARLKNEKGRICLPDLFNVLIDPCINTLIKTIIVSLTNLPKVFLQTISINEDDDTNLSGVHVIDELFESLALELR